MRHNRRAHRRRIRRKAHHTRRANDELIRKLEVIDRKLPGLSGLASVIDNFQISTLRTFLDKALEALKYHRGKEHLDEYVAEIEYWTKALREAVLTDNLGRQRFVNDPSAYDRLLDGIDEIENLAEQARQLQGARPLRF